MMKGGTMYQQKLVILIFFTMVIIGGCKQSHPPLILKEIGPTKTKAGVGFNIQPEGGSAMWAIVVNKTDSTVIVWDNRKLPTFQHAAGIITAPIPEEFYAHPGQHEVFVLDVETGLKSNSIIFTVTE